MNIDWAAASRYIPEIVLVCIFMVYEERNRSAQNIQDMQRDDSWRAFLMEERTERHRASDQLTSILTALVTGVSGNHELIVKHDEWEKQVEKERRHQGGQ